MSSAPVPEPGAPDPPWVREVLSFWFEELNEPDWWRGGEALDARVRARFAGLHERLSTQEQLAALTPDCALAAVLVLDQFSRHLFRGQARAYAADGLARRVARAALARGFDEGMDTHRRHFLYLPFEHSEEREDQRLALELMPRTGDPSLVEYTRRHQAVIERFGRFPHRNAVLGRESTPEELEFLERGRGF